MCGGLWPSQQGADAAHGPRRAGHDRDSRACRRRRRAGRGRLPRPGGESAGAIRTTGHALRRNEPGSASGAHNPDGSCTNLTRAMNLLQATRFLTAVWLLPFAFLAALPAEKPNGTTLSYRRIFKSSTPEFIEIKVNETSDAATFEIRQLDEDASPAPFEVGAPLRARMFELAEQLHHFENVQLDVRRRIANLRDKTSPSEQPTQAPNTKSNYT